MRIVVIETDPCWRLREWSLIVIWSEIGNLSLERYKHTVLGVLRAASHKEFAAQHCMNVKIKFFYTRTKRQDSSSLTSVYTHEKDKSKMTRATSAPLKIAIQRKGIFRSTTGNARLLIFAHPSLEKVGLPLNRDQLHPLKRLTRSINL